MNKKIDTEKIIRKIIEKLKPLDPQRIILFGSHAYGKPNKDSDIDIYVITNDEFIPSSLKENSKLHMKYSKALREVQKEIQIDLIVHTKKMHEKFLKLDSMFSRKIMREGKVIYEKRDNNRVAKSGV